MRFTPGGAAAPKVAVPQTVTGSVVRGFDDMTASFTGSVVARKLTLGLALVALAIGMGLGALHALRRATARRSWPPTWSGSAGRPATASRSG